MTGNGISDGEVELSVVMPCLNEADTLRSCIEKARVAAKTHDIRAEIIVADNGSTDGSLEIARKCGVRIVEVKERGYGAALAGGIEAARGKYVIMGDADDSYDFSSIFPFVQKLREGHDLVMGCRLPGGGGTVKPGAMPFAHRRLGNPMFTFLAKKMFSTPINDVYCGLRGFSRELYHELDLHCTGMEFATEMVIKTCLFRKKIAEVPITLHPDGRRAHAPHLRTVSDGLRTLRFFLLYSPEWLFLAPGLFLFLLGVLSFALILPGPLLIFGRVNLDVQTLLAGGISCLVGYQLVIFAVFTKFFAISEGLMPARSVLVQLSKYVTLRTGLVAGSAVTIIGLALIGVAVVVWSQYGFGDLPVLKTLRLIIPGCILLALGIQTIFSSFFMSILGLKRRK